MDPDRRYWFPVVGYNYRMTNIQAAIGLAQLEQADWQLAQRRRVAETYQKYLGNIRGISLQPELPGYTNSYWMTSLVLDENLPPRDWVMEQLAKQGTETRPFFYPANVLPIYRDCCAGRNFPVAARISSQGLNLPTSADLKKKDIATICERFRVVISGGAGAKS